MDFRQWWPICGFWILVTSGRFGFYTPGSKSTVVADSEFCTLVSDYGFLTLVANFGFWTVGSEFGHLWPINADLSLTKLRFDLMT